MGFIANELDAAARARGTAPSLPTGFVTLLMTDVEGSTGLVQRVGPQFGELVDQVWAAQRRAVSNAGGYEVEAHADEFFAAFESRAPPSTQPRRSSSNPFGSTTSRCIFRVGVRRGYPTRTTSNYIGLDVNITSRVTAVGHGGQIVVSANARDAVRATNARAISFVQLGAHHLRGIAVPVQLYQVAAKGLIRKFPPLRQ